MHDKVHSRILDGRTERPTDVRDELEQSDAASQGYIGIARLQIRAATVSRIVEALARLDAGKYGVCVECDGEMADGRLRAKPFAVRCTACEGKRHQQQPRAHQHSLRRGSLLQFPRAVIS